MTIFHSYVSLPGRVIAKSSIVWGCSVGSSPGVLIVIPHFKMGLSQNNSQIPRGYDDEDYFSDFLMMMMMMVMIPFSLVEGP